MRSAADVYRELAPAVHGYLRAQRVPEPDDVLGEVFLQVARDLGRFEGDDDALRKWVFTIAHHRMVDAFRRQSRRPVIVDHELPELASDGLEDGGLLDDDLIAALDSLTPDQREVIVLRFVADLPIESVATLTKRTEGAVKAMQHRALEQLSRRLTVSPEA